MSEQRVFSADDFDTIEFSALVFGGVGPYHVYDYYSGVPICLHGHATFADGCRGYGSPLSSRIYAAGVKGYESDAAVVAINRRKDRSDSTRVTWGELCAELGIVRGE